MLAGERVGELRVEFHRRRHEGWGKNPQTIKAALVKDRQSQYGFFYKLIPNCSSGVVSSAVFNRQFEPFPASAFDLAV
jgi:hypothetical protein